MSGFSVLVSRMRATVEGVLEPLLRGRPVDALVDFPNYPNVGDSAIYLGQLACLSSLGIGAPRFICDFRTYDRRAMERALGDGVILLTGGGSFGDLWPAGQQCREDILRCFPQHPVIQLPQSVHFVRPDSLARARSLVARHEDLTLLVRDDRSLAVVRREFDCRALLCPDMAFCLGPLARPVAASRPVLWLSRTDKEAASPPPAGAGPITTDWVEEPHTTLRRANYALMGAAVRHPSSRLWRALLMRTYRPLARQRLKRGLRVLSRGRVVVTDRLHGHILSLLLGIPHVLLDTAYGKLSAFHRTWTRDAGGVRFATSPGQAMVEAALLAQDDGSPAATVTVR